MPISTFDDNICLLFFPTTYALIHNQTGCATVAGILRHSLGIPSMITRSTARRKSKGDGITNDTEHFEKP